MLDVIVGYSQIIIADLILSGDNALVIGMAAAGLPSEQRKKAIFYGMLIAAVLRIVFALIATYLLGVKGLLFFGSILLFWVCWTLFKEIKNGSHSEEGVSSDGTLNSLSDSNVPQKTMFSALLSITIADITMSLDNVLAVAGIANGDTQMLVFGLGLAIVLMAFAATLIMKLLAKYHWISWIGLFVLVYVAGEMMYRGFYDISTGIGPMLGLVEGMDMSKHH
ncbi:TerC family protein [Amylibacter sp.]|jgi:YjbE family integral membrane protein|nr:TerC family protein [Amylibacter sp.]MDA9005227.1 TerC family protein [Amylibacter sp.]MDA9242936.1 TerC family protein [Amylibacter sp.]MDB4117281.1 TerC family protein [Amylibacter sp.]MDB4146874.1 TerC family protein [Amylibacter sp.]|tara:strand:- start:122 stop:787 length:666 start_codon:yes stop_codon:yes gene_type:complete